MGLIQLINPTWLRTRVNPTWLRTRLNPTLLRTRLNPTWLRTRLNPTWLRTRVNPTWLRTRVNPTWLRTRFQNEEGSISVLVFGLFAVVLLSGVVLTDISAVIVAQRSLVQATESAAQSAAHALDLDTYYQGKHSALSFLVSDASPVIPIDCKKASERATETLADVANSANRNYGGSSYQSDDSNNISNWSDQLFGGSSKQLVRRELSDVRMSEFQCNGTEVLITTSAKAWLPISLSLFSFESVDLSASARTTSVKKRVLSLFGINF